MLTDSIHHRKSIEQSRWQNSVAGRHQPASVTLASPGPARWTHEWHSHGSGMEGIHGSCTWVPVHQRWSHHYCCQISTASNRDQFWCPIQHYSSRRPTSHLVASWLHWTLSIWKGHNSLLGFYSLPLSFMPTWSWPTPLCEGLHSVWNTNTDSFYSKGVKHWGT